jgi:hypothetical protein
MTRDREQWYQISPKFFVDSQTDTWQSFELPDNGVDVSDVRVVCTKNQKAHLLEQLERTHVGLLDLFDPNLEVPTSVGFFSIRFE